MSVRDFVRTLSGPEIKVRETGWHSLIEAEPSRVPDLATKLVDNAGCDFATLVVEHLEQDFELRYFFYGEGDGSSGLVEVATSVSLGDHVPAISDHVHAADWDEREAEDLFEIHFAGHPFLGDFVLHDTEWPEGVAPMRRGFDRHSCPPEGGRGEMWAPRRVVDEPGTLVFPVGPVWGDYAEAGLWLLETPGELIHHAHTRLFYKYRGVEKIAEGQYVNSVLLLAERFTGNAAFGHGLAFCQAVEKISDTTVPQRAAYLRVVLAELERLRYHVGVIAEITGSTALAVAKAWAQELEEDILRLTGEIFGHRYLFGLVVPGGLARDLAASDRDRLIAAVHEIIGRLNRFEHLLTRSSSFLDRLEEMGTLSPDLAINYGVVGPVARASGRPVDLRLQLPYSAYSDFAVRRPTESEGDGYARLRIFFQETREAGRLITAALNEMQEGSVRAPWAPRAGATLGWAETPAGAAFHWIRINDEGTVHRWRVGTPGFRNWHVYHRAIEGAAFQDFPIILATFGLSVAENDR